MIFETTATKFHDPEMELAVLSLMVIDNSIIPNIVKAVQEGDFFNQFNQQVYRAILNLNAKGPVDILALNKETGYTNSGYIASLTDTMVSSANWEYYTTLVKKYSMLRGLFKVFEVVKDAKAENIEKTIDYVIHETTQLLNIAGGSNIKSAKELVPEMIKAIENAYESKGELIGMDTGFSSINDKLDGFQNDFIIIGARPSIGKTSLIVNMMKKQAMKKIPVGFISCEMKDMKIMFRLLSDMTGINSRSIKNGVLKQSHFQQIQDCAGTMYSTENFPFYIDDSSIKLEQIVSSCRVMVRMKKVKIIYIDHSGMIEVDEAGQRWEQGDKISKTIKKLQRELNVPIVLLSQLKPDAEGKMPTIADLRITGSFSEDGDTIGLLSRDRESKDGQPIPAILDWVKVRDGEIGPSELLFFPTLTRFVDKAK